jgi:hypothetical protein
MLRKISNDNGMRDAAAEEVAVAKVRERPPLEAYTRRLRLRTQVCKSDL